MEKKIGINYTKLNADLTDLIAKYYVSLDNPAYIAFHKDKLDQFITEVIDVLEKNRYKKHLNSIDHSFVESWVLFRTCVFLGKSNLVSTVQVIRHFFSVIPITNHETVFYYLLKLLYFHKHDKSLPARFFTQDITNLFTYTDESELFFLRVALANILTKNNYRHLNISINNIVKRGYAFKQSVQRERCVFTNRKGFNDLLIFNYIISRSHRNDDSSYRVIRMSHD